MVPGAAKEQCDGGHAAEHARGPQSHGRRVSRLQRGEQGAHWKGDGGHAEKGFPHQNWDKVLGDLPSGAGTRRKVSLRKRVGQGAAVPLHIRLAAG